MHAKLVLVDMDGVLADFEGGFLSKWKLRYPERFHVPIADRDTFYQHHQYPEEHHSAMWDIYLEPGFFLGMLPIEGAVEGINAILGAGHEVRICTSPFEQYKNCVGEKYEWVERHLGLGFTRRIILTLDKTLILGNLLIDDRPEIIGLCKPEWEHIIFEAPYNKEVLGKRRMTWANWKEVII